MRKCEWCGYTTERPIGWTGNLCSNKCIKESNEYHAKLNADRKFERDSKKCDCCGTRHLDGICLYMSNGKTYGLYNFCGRECYNEHVDNYSLSECDSAGYTYDSEGRNARNKFNRHINELYQQQLKKDQERAQREQQERDARPWWKKLLD